MNGGEKEVKGEIWVGGREQRGSRLLWELRGGAEMEGDNMTRGGAEEERGEGIQRCRRRMKRRRRS